MEGTRSGFDHELFRAVRERVSIPVIGCGGAGTAAHVIEAVEQDGLDAIACASLFHYGQLFAAGAKGRPDRCRHRRAEGCLMIVVIDYGRGNLFSLGQALRHFGIEYKISDKPATIEGRRAHHFPGVGAFGDAMQGLRDRGLVRAAA